MLDAGVGKKTNAERLGSVFRSEIKGGKTEGVRSNAMRDRPTDDLSFISQAKARSVIDQLGLVEGGDMSGKTPLFFLPQQLFFLFGFELLPVEPLNIGR